MAVDGFQGALDGFSGGVDKFFGGGGLGFGPLEAGFGTFFKAALFASILLIVGLIVFKRMQYNKKVRILTKHGGNVIDMKFDIAKEIIDQQGKRKLVLWNTRKGKYAVTCPVPHQKYRYKVGKKDFYDLWLDDNKNVHPIDLEVVTLKEELKAWISTKAKKEVDAKHVRNKKKVEQSFEGLTHSTDIDLNFTEREMVMLKPKPEERQAWNRLEDEAITKKYRVIDRFKEYLPAAVMIAAFMFSFLILFFMMKFVGNELGGLASAFEQVAKSCLGGG